MNNFSLQQEAEKAATEYNEIKQLHYWSSLIDYIYDQDWNRPGAAITGKQRRQSVIRNMTFVLIQQINGKKTNYHIKHTKECGMKKIDLPICNCPPDFNNIKHNEDCPNYEFDNGSSPYPCYCNE